MTPPSFVPPLLLSLLLLAPAAAHLPRFPDADAVLDVGATWRTQSFGVYVAGGGAPLTMHLDVARPDDDMALSLSVPGHHAADPAAFNVTLTGPADAAGTTLRCPGNFDGWHGDDSEARPTVDVPPHRATGPPVWTVPATPHHRAVFEPWGVGYYRPVRACRPTTLVPGRYTVRVAAGGDTRPPYSVAIGMAEAWENFVNPLLPFRLARTYTWMGQPNVALAPASAGAVFLVVAALFVGTRRDAAVRGALLVLVAVHVAGFAAHAGWVLLGDGAPAGAAEKENQWAITAVVQVAMPLAAAAALAWRYRLSRTTASITAWIVVDAVLVAYLFMGAWHAYFAPQVLVLLAVADAAVAAAGADGQYARVPV